MQGDPPCRIAFNDGLQTSRCTICLRVGGPELVETCRHRPEAPAVGEAERLRQIIVDLFAPDQHYDGCMFKENPRLPCQCGFNRRMNRYRRAVEVAREIAAKHDYRSGRNVDV